MFDVNVATVLVVSLLVMVALGVHIAIALGMTSALGIFLVTGGTALVYQVTWLLRSRPDEIVPERQTSHYRDGLSLKQAEVRLS